MNFIFVVIGFIFICVSLSLKIVSQGYNYTIERFGKFNRILHPGIHFIVPVVERVGAKVNMMENYLDLPGQNVFSMDNAAVHVDGIIFYRVIDAYKSVYNVTDLDSSVTLLTMTNIRTVMGALNLDELLSHRDQINAKLKAVIDEAAQPWGIIITRVEIKDIQPPQNLLEAMGRQMKAERDKRAKILEAEGIRESEIQKAEGFKRAEILQAEASKEAKLLEAEAKERLAQAEAFATKTVSDAISKGKPQALQYFIAKEYVLAFAKMAEAENQKTIIVPYESSQLMGSIASIKELLKQE
ncbi:MAG: SPFH/Band 7/PHB domain protein [Alphaproteobacteria bacterium]|nr:MAG: SPFH/Band 7/PHB domain protein [Alphaproteobacteria bacterium]